MSLLRLVDCRHGERRQLPVPLHIASSVRQRRVPRSRSGEMRRLSGGYQCNASSILKHCLCMARSVYLFNCILTECMGTPSSTLLFGWNMPTIWWVPAVVPRVLEHWLCVGNGESGCLSSQLHIASSLRQRTPGTCKVLRLLTFFVEMALNRCF